MEGRNINSLKCPTTTSSTTWFVVENSENLDKRRHAIVLLYICSRLGCLMTWWLSLFVGSCDCLFFPTSLIAIACTRSVYNMCNCLRERCENAKKRGRTEQVIFLSRSLACARGGRARECAACLWNSIRPNFGHSTSRRHLYQQHLRKGADSRVLSTSIPSFIAYFLKDAT